MAVWLGADVGTVRIGVAKSDATELLATPLTTVATTRDGADVSAFLALVREYDAAGVVIGRPVTLRGHSGASVAMAENFATSVRAASPEISIEFVDERHTTVTASRRLREAGVSAREQRGRLDAYAAAELLQLWLDTRRHRRDTQVPDTPVQEATR